MSSTRHVQTCKYTSVHGTYAVVHEFSTYMFIPCTYMSVQCTLTVLLISNIYVCFHGKQCLVSLSVEKTDDRKVAAKKVLLMHLRLAVIARLIGSHVGPDGK